MDDIEEKIKSQCKISKIRADSECSSGSCRTPRSNTRDSGYATDSSPATHHAKTHFTFDTCQQHYDQVGATGDTGGDAISESSSPVDIFLGDDDDDDGDDSPFLDNAISDNLLDSRENIELLQVERFRPRSGAFLHALPDPRALSADRNGIPIPLVLPGGHRIRPLGLSRTVGTQTPHLHCLLIRQVMSQHDLLSSTPGTVHQRLRCYSEGEDYPDEQEQSGPLPDIVCNIRDRSVSLPDVQVLRRQREVEVGRELRRISDEFHSQYQRRRFLPAVQENFDGEASSFPGARRPSINKMMDALKVFFRRGSGGDPDTEDPPGPT